MRKAQPVRALFLRMKRTQLETAAGVDVCAAARIRSCRPGRRTFVFTSGAVRPR
jgi:hypothetical protein